MFSDMFVKLWQQNLFLLGVWQTIYLTVISTVFAYVLGLPLGLLLCVSDKDGIHPMPVLNKILSILINAFRSVPFIILMVAMLPVAKFIVGTSLGNKAVIVTLVIAAAPYVARMVESSIKEVDKGVIEAAEAMGTPRFQIITKVLVPEAKPSLITGAVISMVTVLGYSAMAATIGGTRSRPDRHCLRSPALQSGYHLVRRAAVHHHCSGHSGSRNVHCPQDGQTHLRLMI